MFQPVQLRPILLWHMVNLPQSPYFHSFPPSQDKRQAPVASISWAIAAVLMQTLNKLVAFSRCNHKDVADLMEKDSQRLLAGWDALPTCILLEVHIILNFCHLHCSLLEPELPCIFINSIGMYFFLQLQILLQLNGGSLIIAQKLGEHKKRIKLYKSNCMTSLYNKHASTVSTMQRQRCMLLRAHRVQER